ncbi:MAG: glycosyltransferase family 2 protein [Proteobacteria bacterium]|nr:glycosyltransferase family 2 protein [Pseudomonadota bacterium]
MSSLQISIVVPTYGEEKNIPLLVERIDNVLTNTDYSYEIIISDDVSGDNTEQVCQELAQRFPLRLLSRTENRGLSPAVIDGITIATGDAVIVMDADLSHPPEKIIDIAELLLKKEADFVVGSRYVKGGGLDESWPWWRWLNSIIATLPARWLVPLADPMSGFFGLRRADMPAMEILSPIGYKIGLELLVKSGFRKERVREVPILFRDRIHGESKMTLREQLNYLRHLRRLYHYRWPKYIEILQFLAVGSCGLIIDIACYLLLIAFGTPHLIARACSYVPAVTFNWLLNRTMTFGHRPRRPQLAQWLQYSVGSIVGFCASWGTYALATQYISFFDEHRLLAFITGVVVATVFNFLLSDLLIFRKAPPKNSD